LFVIEAAAVSSGGSGGDGDGDGGGRSLCHFPQNSNIV